MSHVRIKDAIKVEEKVRKLVDGNHEKLQVLLYFLLH